MLLDGSTLKWCMDMSIDITECSNSFVSAELTARICNSNVLNDDYSVIVMN